MRKVIALALAGIALLLLVRVSAQTTRYPEDFPEEMKRAMDEFQRRAKADLEGQLGQKARDTCNRIHGITIQVKNSQDVLRSYGLQKMKDWTHCVLDTMYPK
jgi:hypothetical protein